MTTPAEEQPLSRRQLRELQKSGRPSSTGTRAPTDAPDVEPTTAEPYAKVAPTDEVIETAEIVSSSSGDTVDESAPVPTGAPEVTAHESDPVVPAIPADGVPLTRRQARELERVRTASISVIGADQGSSSDETGEVVTAEAIEDPTGEHAPVVAPEAELAVVEKGASETGDLTEAVVDVDPAPAEATDSGGQDTSEPATIVAGDFGEAALETDTDPLAEEQPFDELIATGIAEAEQTPTTSSTLIVGSPMTTFTGPIGGTGEIMVTGSIDLPRTLTGTADPGSGGDRADYDRSLDHEPPAPPTAGTPVSASRAVSTHTSARDIIAPPARSKRPSIVPVLAIIAGVLMVAVLAVVVTSLLTGTL
ncbi:hypothetical protein CLV49_3322 [Labedella gwakjiensis]|uniref:Uncharacterized protein n=1 Tax=Labedella gwakjiensis TaxID=390269 RepID=A0A2P8H0C0_9MICO|nr:hypothetical protein [Labedella gwakjiensis]PSL39677.1 hypothetical protein CLV49_3322 [Labedella gwakjiensis]RUQ85935.1 hypothetical protein ELQ93_02645 [Labedella gwakjiensis]